MIVNLSPKNKIFKQLNWNHKYFFYYYNGHMFAINVNDKSQTC